MHPIHAARASGLSQYETGKPCPKGHVGARFVSSRQCVVCAGKRKKSWADKNRHYVSKYNNLYYHQDAEHQRQRTRDYVAANRDAILIKRRAAYRADPDRAMEWARNNPERAKEIHRKW